MYSVYAHQWRIINFKVVLPLNFESVELLMVGIFDILDFLVIRNVFEFHFSVLCVIQSSVKCQNCPRNCCFVENSIESSNSDFKSDCLKMFLFIAPFICHGYYVAHQAYRMFYRYATIEEFILFSSVSLIYFCCTMCQYLWALSTIV